MRKVLGIAGTAKNTGKTTTLLSAMEYLSKRVSPEALFLTSIGYDGEDFDNITGLPKPKVDVVPGSLVATALPLMKASSVEFDCMNDTGVRCALGRVFIGRARTRGRVVLAGPTSTKALTEILGQAPEGSLVLLDGAFSRLSPMVLATHLVLATGAARNRDPRRIALELDTVSAIMKIPPADGLDNRPGSEKAKASLRLTGGLFLKGQGQELSWMLTGSNETPEIVLVEGVVNPAVLMEALKEVNGHPGLSFVFSHPIAMLLSGDLGLWDEVLDLAGKLGHRVFVRNTGKLLGVTVNPYLPEYQPGTRRFIASHVPPRVFLEDIRNLVSLRCTDIVLEGPDILYSWLEEMLSTDEKTSGKREGS